MDQFKDFVTKSIRETISAPSSSKSRSLDAIAGELAKDFSDADFFSYHRNIKVGSSPFSSYCQIRFQVSEEEIQAIITEINKAAGIDASDSLPPVVVVDAPSSSDFFRPIIEFVKRQYDLKRGISGFEYFIKTILGSSGVAHLIYSVDSGTWPSWFIIKWIFIPFIYYSSVQRVNKLGFHFRVTYFSIFSVSVLSIIDYLLLSDHRLDEQIYYLYVPYAFFLFAGIPKWFKRTPDVLQ